MLGITTPVAPTHAQMEAQRRGAVTNTNQAQQQSAPLAPFYELPSDLSWILANFLRLRDRVALKISNKGTYDDIDTTINKLITSDIRTINKEALKYIFKFGTGAQLTHVFDKGIQELISLDLSCTASDRENIASVILHIAMIDEGITALIANPNVITRLTTLAMQANTELGREYIVAAIFKISNRPAGRTALIANGAITTLNHLANQDNTEVGRSNIAAAIFNISTRPAGITALIANGAITTLNHLAGQANIEYVREKIVRAIRNIAMSDEGRTALIANGALTTLNHLANQDNTEVGREYIEEAKTLLKSNRYCTIS